MRTVKKFGYRPDFGDPRDYVYQLSGEPLKESVDLRPNMKAPCWDQGDLGCCTGFGITAIIAYLHGFVGSQLWLYYMERRIEKCVRQDSGAMIRDGIKVVHKQGLPPLETWPYDTAKFKKCPPKALNEVAKQNLITQYKRLDGADAYRDCLSQGHPFVVGITVFEGFESATVAKTGIVPMPTAKEEMLGGHCISVFGYTKNGDWICRNSWGTDWGQKGYFILPKAYLESNDLATDAWMVIA
jgi:C1A family cysteine protease